MNNNPIEKYNHIRSELLAVSQDISSLFLKAKSIDGISNEIVKDWEKPWYALKKKMSEWIFRVAIVGPLKSGKSTFVNSLLRGDYLKRGAGATTSMITRVRGGKDTKAKLQFKSWEEVNAEIEQALVLFSVPKRNLEDGQFDIRRENDRSALRDALSTLAPENRTDSGTLNPNTLMLTCYLKGYQKIKETLGPDSSIVEYGNDLFRKHWDFVSQESPSAYLKDIQLKVHSDYLTSDVEIADCQGSDSSNPLYLTMIQDYLLSAHLIIYVISSRIGLRRADIRFLSMLKKMEIIDDVFFVINCDISEHETFEELISIVAKVREEISLFKADPKIYTLSALFSLFKAIHHNLPGRDRLRLEQWEKQQDFAELSIREAARFESDFHNELIRRRYFHILNNAIQRQARILSGIKNWIRVNRKILAEDVDKANQLSSRISQQQERMNRIKVAVKSTLESAVPRVKQEIKTEVNRFFDLRSGTVLGSIIEFVKGYAVSSKKYEKSLESEGFSNTLYLAYQDFKQALDTNIAENLQPELIHFVRQIEKKISTRFQEVLDPYEAIVENANIEANNMMAEFGIEHRIPAKNQSIGLADMDLLKEAAGLKVRPLLAYLNYSAKIRTEAVMRLGFYTAIRIFQKIFARQTGDKRKDELQALQSIIQRMKRETQKAFIYHCGNYQESLELNYLFKLIDVASDQLYEALLECFQTYITDLSITVGQISQGQIDKQRVSEALKEMELIVDGINTRMTLIQSNIDLQKFELVPS